MDHVGIGVPDVDAARSYYDQLMPLVGYQPCFGNGYCPEDWNGAQLFLYPAPEPDPHARNGVGLQHLAFLVLERAVVDRVHTWVEERGDEVLHAPRAFPEYGPHCYATFFLDPHGFKLEVVSHNPPEDPGPVSDRD